MKIDKKTMVKLYTDMVRVRKLDAKHMECLMAGKIQMFFHSGLGQEAPGVALCAQLNDDDYLYYNHRSHGMNKCLPKGVPAGEILAEHMGKENGVCGGYGGAHIVKPEVGILGSMLTVGGEFTIAAGTAIACQMEGKGQVVVNCFGDGSTGRGSFHEALLLSAAWKLPVVWFLENNLYQMYTYTGLTHMKKDLADFGYGYDIPSVVVDGQDVLAVYEAVEPALARAREGKGPTLIEVKTYRYRVHNEGFPDYSVTFENMRRPEQEVEEWKKRDPVEMFEKTLIEKKILTKKEIEAINDDVKKEMDDAEKFALEGGYPDPSRFNDVLYAS